MKNSKGHDHYASIAYVVHSNKSDRNEDHHVTSQPSDSVHLELSKETPNVQETNDRSHNMKGRKSAASHEGVLSKRGDKYFDENPAGNPQAVQSAVEAEAEQWLAGLLTRRAAITHGSNRSTQRHAASANPTRFPRPETARTSPQGHRAVLQLMEHTFEASTTHRICESHCCIAHTSHICRPLMLDSDPPRTSTQGPPARCSRPASRARSARASPLRNRARCGAGQAPNSPPPPASRARLSPRPS